MNMLARESVLFMCVARVLFLRVVGQYRGGSDIALVSVRFHRVHKQLQILNLRVSGAILSTIWYDTQGLI